MEIDTITQYFEANNIIINWDDVSTLKRYLERVLEKGGTNNMHVIRNILNIFFVFTHTTSIQDISTEIIMDYFDNMKNAGYKYNYINSHRLIIGAFLNFYTKLHKKQGFINPMPDKTLYEIKKPILTEEEQEQLNNSLFYTIDELLIILHRAYHISQGTNNFVTRESFVMLGLMIVTGARESEITTIKLKNFHLEDRYFYTGNVDNANKNHKSLTFCFPKELIKLLQLHLLDRQQFRKDSIWLFPGLYKEKDNHTMNHNIALYMKGLFKANEFTKPLLSHSLRRTLTTFRCCPSHIEETLSNHAVTSIIMKYYKLTNWIARRDIYDQYFPNEYTLILEFLQNC